jgi:hypothetical protein
MRIGLHLLTLLSLALISRAAVAADAPADKPRPLEPPPGATLPVKGEQLRLARNKLGQVVELRDLDDPANPYAGQYSAVDRWYFEHYVPGVTPEEEKHFGG